MACRGNKDLEEVTICSRVRVVVELYYGGIPVPVSKLEAHSIHRLSTHSRRRGTALSIQCPFLPWGWLSFLGKTP